MAKFTEAPDLFPALAPFQHHDFFITSHEDCPRQAAADYWPLATVLCAAYAQAEGGKGKERHALGDPFLNQPIMSIGRLLKSADGEVYQSMKKMREGLQMAKRGKHDAAIREFLGAINYAAAAAILLAEEGHEKLVREFSEMRRNQPSVTEVDEGTSTAENVQLKLRIDTSEMQEKLAEVRRELEDAAQKIGRSKFLLENAEFRLISKDRSRFMTASCDQVESLLAEGWEFFGKTQGYNLQTLIFMDPETFPREPIKEDVVAGLGHDVEISEWPQPEELISDIDTTDPVVEDSLTPAPREVTEPPAGWEQTEQPHPGEEPNWLQYYTAVRRAGHNHADAERIADAVEDRFPSPRPKCNNAVFIAREAMNKWRNS